MTKVLKVPLRYLPTRLTQKDRLKQTRGLKKSRRLYKSKQYYSRPKLRSFKSKPSSHVTTAKKMYGVDTIGATRELANKTGCSIMALKKIIRKGEGAYYSSGSRPNQSAQSWGLARLASAITSGKAAAVDFSILAKGCTKSSRALKLAKKARSTYGHGQSATRKVKLIP
jgi:hypothetical protein